MAKKNVKSEDPKKKKPISLNILEIAKRLQKIEETGGGTPYTLPTASADTKGGVKIGTGLSMTGEVLSADAVDAADIAYDNMDSGLTADTVQGAIDEVFGDISGLSANDISYGSGSVEDALDGLTVDTGWVQIGTTGIYYRKTGNVVWVRGETNVHNDFTTIATLPTGYRPVYSFRRSVMTGASGGYHATLLFDTDGRVMAFSSYNINFMESFLID